MDDRALELVRFIAESLVIEKDEVRVRMIERDRAYWSSASPRRHGPRHRQAGAHRQGYSFRGQVGHLRSENGTRSIS